MGQLAYTEDCAVLGNGTLMPLAGFGTWELRGGACSDLVSLALRLGGRHIDTPRMYGNEEAVGLGIRKSGVPREKIFLTTKLMDSGGFRNSLRDIGDSLRKLGTDYVDLLLLHEPYGGKYEIYRAMEQALEDGRARAIGVSNFNLQALGEFSSRVRVMPMADQVEAHVLLQREEFARRLISAGIAPVAWSPLGGGGAGIPSNPLLAEIGRAHGKSAAQTALRFLTEECFAVIPRTSDPGRIKENHEILDFTLGSEEMERIRELDCGRASSAGLRLMSDNEAAQRMPPRPSFEPGIIPPRSAYA